MGAQESIDDDEYARAQAALSGLISGRQRKDTGRWAHAFDMMQTYLEVRLPMLAGGVPAACRRLWRLPPPLPTRLLPPPLP